MDRIRNTALVTAALAAGAIALSACGRDDRDLVNGKTLYVNKCGACHQLARADTKGTQGPSLDAAFETARADGMTAKTVEGIVYRQIGHPRRGSIMPAGLVKGSDAWDVAAYVGEAAGIKGKDQGPLAEAGKPKTSNKPIAAKAGTLTIDAIDGTAFQSTQATATAGKLTVKMPNKSDIGHDIALQGVSGADGDVVQKGGTSTFTVDLKAGKYTFLCTVPGHEQAGMKGTLTVK
ncbi:MAG TPA: c-type cytochrome [Thermoleophilaceae bacterium]